jgi:hypothetical protein
MTVNAPNPFPADALEANRRGQLTNAQLQGLRHLAQSRRRSGVRIAAVLVVVAVLIGLYASPSTSHAARVLIPLACFAIAAFLVMRFVSGADALTRDLRRGKVQCVEGAIGKSRVSDHGHEALHYLEVGDTRFSASHAAYEGAPDAGYVRLYFLPLSRRVVSVERLPDSPLQADISLQSVAQSLGASLGARSRRERNEARANLAGISNAVEAAFAAPNPPPAPEARDPRPLAQAILGTWSNGLVTVTFSADGQASTQMMGRDRPGYWSIDADGRLHADVAGQQIVAEAWVSGDQLSVLAEGRGLTLSRRRTVE